MSDHPIIIDSGPSGVIRIPLTRGRFAIVDDVDAAQAAHKWFAINVSDDHWYAARHEDDQYILLHRAILKTDAPRIDHINGNGLDCRRSNMRPSTPSQNGANAKRSKANKSGFKGVAWDSTRGKWFASIRVDRRTIALGRFDDIIVAALAYDSAARQHFGPFARTNFTEGV
jgi:hypothetical protein